MQNILQLFKSFTQPTISTYFSIVLFCYNRMYRRFTDSKCLGSLPYSRIVLNDIAGDIHSPLFNIILQRKPLRTLFYIV